MCIRDSDGVVHLCELVIDKDPQVLVLVLALLATCWGLPALVMLEPMDLPNRSSDTNCHGLIIHSNLPVQPSKLSLEPWTLFANKSCECLT